MSLEASTDMLLLLSAVFLLFWDGLFEIRLIYKQRYPVET